ncbi:hypothetical protein SAMN06264364_13655 [Quadrisphaera granulorum]|uniref:Probable membrane transporter protein n=1 Tax=Quadrisphaera granulorum TaxID=317664 RepID=A0A315ZR83_9ACTN|nr:TSUP family transporter [Quadrisphaera granulorum]PWJ47623.1 hypothetical protein BXY45_13655 [Quadrisphaera granulorum]SZE98753.1 hypothetical protein SAMN06264364_13655 [Quadrisphaera granulorum]
MSDVLTSSISNPLGSPVGSPLDWPVASLAAVAAAMAAGAFAQGVTGIGLVLIAGPALILTLGPDQGVRVAVLASLVLNAAMLTRGWRAVRVRDGARLCLPAVALTPVAASLAGQLTGRTSLAAAGLAILAAAGLLAAGRSWPWLASSWGALGAGTAAAVMNVLAGVAGPAAALYAVNARWAPATATATLQACFAAINLTALVFLGPPTHAGPVAAAAVGVLAGLATSVPVTRRVSARAARGLVLVLCAFGGALLLGRALSP